jgi:hypothetical protein
MIERKVISVGINFRNKIFKAKEPPTSGGIIYVNKFKSPDEHSVKTMQVIDRGYEVFNNGFNHKK